MTRLRIGLFTHSTNPRGGVVHTLELAEALCRLGHQAVVHAPDPAGRGFFRPAGCPTVAIRASVVDGGITAMVEARIADIVAHFRTGGRPTFDVWHAGDGISANALATLKEEGRVPSFVRTVHHLDTFADPRLQSLQERAVRSADRHLVVSRLWRDELARRHGVAARIVGNGVDRRRFSPFPDEGDGALRRDLVAPGGPIFLAVGGIEQRKNSLRLLDAFAALHHRRPAVRLVIAGGATLLDHGDYQRRFADRLAAHGLPAAAVLRLGPLPQALMPALYRSAHALAFPSLTEGFGLAVLEAMASGVPVVASRRAPFTEYLGDGDVLWCDPEDAASIAAAMERSFDRPAADRLRRRGRAVSARHDWTSVARRHLAAYHPLVERHHA